MNFAENPILFIDEYYANKKNKIDLDCEHLILKCKNEKRIQKLNDVRMSLIEELDSAKQTVLERYDTLGSKYTEEMLRENAQQIKDEVFSDHYCFIIDLDDVYPLLELKFCLLLFTEFDDHLLEDLLWAFLFGQNFKTFI